MAEYLAVMRKIGETVPRKLTFEAAERPGAALNEMERRAGVTTSGLVEFELMQVVDNGKAYIPVAAKRAPKNEKRTAVVLMDDDVTDVSKSDVEAASNVSKDTEQYYDPYIVAAA